VGICIEKGARSFVGKQKKRSCLLVADTADTTVVSAVSATTRHDRRVRSSQARPSCP